MGLVVSSLSVRCGNKSVLSNINLNVEDGEICSLRGNKRKCRLLMRVLSELAKQRIGACATVSSAVSRELFGFMRAKDYCVYQLGLKEMSRKEKEELASRALTTVGFSAREQNKKVKWFSREQCLTLALAEALLAEPKVIFLLAHASGRLYSRAVEAVQNKNIALVAAHRMKNSKTVLVG